MSVHSDPPTSPAMGSSLLVARVSSTLKGLGSRRCPAGDDASEDEEADRPDDDDAKDGTGADRSDGDDEARIRNEIRPLAVAPDGRTAGVGDDDGPPRLEEKDRATMPPPLWLPLLLPLLLLPLWLLPLLPHRRLTISFHAATPSRWTECFRTMSMLLSVLAVIMRVANRKSFLMMWISRSAPAVQGANYEGSSK
jgi:hypothetical protein